MVSPTNLSDDSQESNFAFFPLAKKVLSCINVVIVESAFIEAGTSYITAMPDPL